MKLYLIWGYSARGWQSIRMEGSIAYSAAHLTAGFIPAASPPEVTMAIPSDIDGAGNNGASQGMASMSGAEHGAGPDQGLGTVGRK